MIASAVAGSTGAALTLGLVTATAVLCSLVATAVTGPRPAPLRRGDPAQVEAMVRRLVEAGADEAAVRALVTEARRLGRSSDLGSSSRPEAPI
jgi:hypothetical protein